MSDALAPFTQLWADAFHAAIEGDADYRASASGWKWPIALVMDPAPEHGYPRAVAVEVMLDRGHSYGATAIPAGEVSAPFVLQGTYATWKAVMREGLDPVLAVATGKLSLAKGALTTLMLHTGSARKLVGLARRIPTRFPDDA